jgi:hypothetical protein
MLPCCPCGQLQQQAWCLRLCFLQPPSLTLWRHAPCWQQHLLPALLADAVGWSFLQTLLLLPPCCCVVG